MTIKHFTIFVTVAEEGSMSAAAQKLYLSQPTVSQSIRELEEHYQVKLFERLSKKLFITEEGRRLLALAHQVLNQYTLLETSMRKEQQISSLRIGSSITVGTCLIPDIITKLEQQLPNIHMHSVSCNTREIEQLLLKSKLDVAIVEGDITSSDLLCFPIIQDSLVLACSKSHPFYQKEIIYSYELEHEKFSMREEGSGTRKLFEQYLRRRSIPIQPYWEANCPRTILNAVLKNNALAVLSARLMKHETQKGLIKMFCCETDEWTRYFQLVYHKNKFLTPEIQLLKQILSDEQNLFIPSMEQAGILTDRMQADCS